MPKGKTIGLLFIEGCADWEFGLLSAAIGGGEEWFDGRVVALSPEGKPVKSIGGLRLAPERGTDPEANQDLDGIAVIGSDGWLQAAPDVTPLLTSVARRGGVIGGICAGTLALARAGLFAKAAHTSNSREWITHCVPDYDGQENYRDVPHAVADGRIVSAPGTAPLTFAAEFVRTLHPDQAGKVAEMTAAFTKEYRG
ncbi:DJ-1/PfpI family protein [Taklimakanibacter deserti]|uniref:DJ-1/PfpI family protein n=1 Tax=Taklimakanibacter deserti TaxID=2267839 RepID=UPI000E6493A7